jgi:hypothetical protein
MYHQNLNIILQMQEERVKTHVAETREAQLRGQIESERPSWISTQTRSMLCRVGSRLVAWGRWLECYSYRKLSPSR